MAVPDKVPHSFLPSLVPK